VKEDRETRGRLLLEARRLFADQGFKRVTVREICRAAGANVAAVNYHFGDKMGLYREVLQQAIDGMVRSNGEARAAGEGRRPEEKLRQFLRIFLLQLVKPEFAIYHRLVQRELQDPTPMLDVFAKQGIKPRLEYLAGVVAEMIGLDPSDGRVMQCVGSINAQAVIYLPNPVATRLGYEFKGTPAEIEKAVEHIVTFSLGGVDAVGRAAQSPAQRAQRIGVGRTPGGHHAGDERRSRHRHRG
jgi:TetR/AcrR family transcriptional regulator, regulator of cefoperazone and chloramphenicol sensitivity